MVSRLCVCLFFVAVVSTSGEQHWSYRPSTGAAGTEAQPFGPNEWSKYIVKDAKGVEHEYCGVAGTQSPIDATFSSATPLVKSGNAATDFTLTSKPGCAKAEFMMNAHTTEVSLKECEGSYNATWGGKTYYLIQYHWHSPSEHQLDGRYYPMEVHHVMNTKIDSSGEFLVLGVFMDASNTSLAARCLVGGVLNVTSPECERANFFDTVQKAMPVPQPNEQPTCPNGHGFCKADATTAHDPFTGFIPPMPSHFYHYTGSFTTPGCNPNVTWILNPTPVTIFDKSLTFYREAIQKYPDNQLYADKTITMASFTDGAGFTWNETLGNNNRPIQPLAPNRAFYIVGQAPSPGSTVLTAEAPVGSTTLAVESNLGFQVGEEIVIGLGTAAEVRTISSEAASAARRLSQSGSINVNAGLTGMHPIGTPVKVQQTTVTVTTTKKPPYDSSASSSGTSNSLKSSMSSSDSSGESDVSGSQESSSDASGSSGFYMSLWKWFLLAGLLCCCLIAVAAICASMGKPKPKPKPKKAAPPPKPKPVEEPKEEEYPLMEIPPLMPLYNPSFGTTTYTAPMATSYAAPMTTSYAAPATYSMGYPGTVV